jgi:prephenate dehydratase/chorismate mutase/prephenate dehydratase
MKPDDPRLSNLHDIRKNIDAVDAQILRLLNLRFEYALQTRRFKAQGEDPEREEAVLRTARRRAGRLAGPEFAARIYEAILGESKALQKKDLKLAGFQGEPGAYSEAAVEAWNPAWVPVACREFGEVFEGVRQGRLDYGVIPVENSLEGPVTAANEMLIETDLSIVGGVRLPIHHCLLARPETDYREIRAVYSHPMALAQCRGFLARNGLEPRMVYDTAGAARKVAEDLSRTAAAIADERCAELYDLEILKADIEDHPSNATRFVVLAREPEEGDGDKCSIVFAVPDKAGALISLLKIFAEADINLTRIESRPLRKTPGQIAFLLDFQGSPRDGTVAAVLENVNRHSAMSRFLGCYKEIRP